MNNINSSSTIRKKTIESNKILYRKSIPSALNSFISGAVAGAIAKSAVAPFDRVKILYQVSDSKQFTIRNAYKLFLQIYHSEGINGLWRGNSSMMIRIVPYAALQFMSFEIYKSKAIEFSTVSTDSSNLSISSRFICGALAGATSVFFTYPLDLIRARFAVHKHYYNLSVVQSFQKMIKAEGYSSLLRGIVPTLAGIIPYAGISFCCYETLKYIYLENEYNKKLQLYYNDENNNMKPIKIEKLGIIPRFLFGATSGAISQTISYPLDVIRRRLQVYEGINKYTITDTAIYIYKNDGISGLFKGVTMNWIKGPIALGLSFTVYDYMKYKFMNKKDIYI